MCSNCQKQNRNELCSCGSGKKYKKCCGFKAMTKRQLQAQVLRVGSLPFAAGVSAKGLADRVFKAFPQDKPAEVGAFSGKEVQLQERGEKNLLSKLQTSG